MRIGYFTLMLVFITACSTRGHLLYITVNGEQKIACETEYSGAPSVDKYAVVYVLSYCARKAQEQGHKVVDEYLTSIELSIPPSPDNQPWTFEKATELYDSGQLTDKEYGYLIAYIDLGLNELPE